MLHLAEAKQIGKGELSPYAELPWKDFSQKLDRLGYRQVNEVLIPHVGSLHILSRHDYSPPSFLSRNEPVRMSSTAMVKVYSGKDEVRHISITRPGVQLSVEELVQDADVMGRYFIDETRPFEIRLLPNGWVVLGIYAGIGLAAGVGVAELLYSKLPEPKDSTNSLDVMFGFLFSVGVPMARILFESMVRRPALLMKAASQMNVSSYLFGSEAVNSVNNESSAQQFETAASLVHAELKSSGVTVDEELFYRAFAIIQNLGVEKAEKIAPVTRVPLERIIQVVKAHTGLLPAPVSAK